jgi:hypothetical protein
MNYGGKRLEELLRENRFTVAEVARAIDVNWKTIGNWREDNAPVGKLWEIHKHTKISFNQILGCFIPIDTQAEDPIDNN